VLWIIDNKCLVKIFFQLDLALQVPLDISEKILNLGNILIGNLVELLNHGENGVHVILAAALLTQLILLDQEWVLVAALWQVFQNLAMALGLIQFRNGFCENGVFLGLYFVLNFEIWIWIRIFVGSGSLIKKKLFFLRMSLRFYRRVALEIYQLTIFGLDLQLLVVTGVMGRLLRDAYLGGRHVEVQVLKMVLCGWPIYIVFYEIVGFFWGEIRAVFGDCQRHSGAHSVLKDLATKSFVKCEPSLALYLLLQLFKVCLIIYLYILIWREFRILLDHIEWLSNRIGRFSSLLVRKLNWALISADRGGDQLINGNITFMFILYPLLIPGGRIFETKNVCPRISLGSASVHNSLDAGSWLPTLPFFGQNGRSLFGRIISRTDVVILGYKVCQIPLPLAGAIGCFALVYRASNWIWLFTISRNGCYRRKMLSAVPLCWRHWLEVLITNNLAWSLLNVMTLVDGGVVPWPLLDVVLPDDEAETLLDGGSLGESLLASGVWTFNISQALIHFIFEFFKILVIIKS
jgi:hypothetical protein